MINVDENGVRFSIISAKNARYLEEEILEFGEVACGEDGEWIEESYIKEVDKNGEIVGFYTLKLGEITILKSPNIVYANALCSPCVPNAAHLDEGWTDRPARGFKCYGLPDWALEDCVNNNDDEE